MSDTDRYPPIGDYALIGDCHTAALVSRRGSIDWCCLPRFDSGSTFGRILDSDSGGHCSIAPTDGGPWSCEREYLDDTLVLASTVRSRSGQVRIIDCFAKGVGTTPEHGTGAKTTRDHQNGAKTTRDHQNGAQTSPDHQILRVIEGVRGTVELELEVVPRFDYGQVRPWIRRHGHHVHTALGGNDALVVWCEQELTEDVQHQLVGRFTVGTGERVRISLSYCAPELIDAAGVPEPDRATIDRVLEETIDWWRAWAAGVALDSRDEAAARRSAIVLKALTYEPTGAVVAAPTTSLPETIGGERNWDYRYAWVRDSSFSSRAFAELGCVQEADAFRAFIMRSAAGHAEDLQVLYGVGGERRTQGEVLGELDGYRSARPVRIGNDATSQRQLDAYGELVNLTWRWHRRGHSPGDDDWRFLLSLIDHAAEQCAAPDRGIWEFPGEPEHFVHSKVLCWSALDRGIRLADECMRRAPVSRWKRARDKLRRAIERRGYDRDRGIFVGVYDRPELMRRCCCCRPSNSSTGATSGCSARRRRSEPSSAPATASSTATAATTACPGGRARSCAVRSGWRSA